MIVAINGTTIFNCMEGIVSSMKDACLLFSALREKSFNSDGGSRWITAEDKLHEWNSRVMIKIEKGAGRQSDSLHNILDGKPPKNKRENNPRAVNLGGLFSLV